MDRYVIVDLEMCNVPVIKRTEDYRYKNEIIQIGAVLLGEDLEICDSFVSYVRPQLGALDPFITGLTGIKDSDLAGAPTYEEALNAFLNWVPKNAKPVSWSRNDERQMRREANAKSIQSPELDMLLDCWIDCQKTFGDIMCVSRNYGLVEALNISSVDYDKNAHDALVDAKNTASLFAKMEREKNSEFILSPYISIGQSEHSGYTPFADLFKTLSPVVA